MANDIISAFLPGAELLRAFLFAWGKHFVFSPNHQLTAFRTTPPDLTLGHQRRSKGLYNSLKTLIDA